MAQQALLCRRYEKDFFLNAGDIVAQDAPLQQWHTATFALRTAIKVYSDTAITEADKQQAQRWSVAWGEYIRDFGAVEIAINGGVVENAQDALLAFEPSQGNIQQLTDEALQVAQDKTATARIASEDLHTTIRHIIMLILAIAVVVLAVSILWASLFPRQLMRPILALREGARRLVDGDYSVRVSVDSHDEIGQLAQSYNDMTAVIQQRTSELDHQYAQAQQALLAAEVAHQQLSQQLAVIEEQRAVILDMSIPILPLTDKILIMPLVGTIDTERIQQLHRVVLEAIEQHHASHMLIDITGVPVVDSEVSMGFIHVVHAARLLGCQATLVGFRPEVAQSVVGLGVDLQALRTYSTLQGGLRATLGHPLA